MLCMVEMKDPAVETMLAELRQQMAEVDDILAADPHDDEAAKARSRAQHTCGSHSAMRSSAALIRPQPAHLADRPVARCQVRAELLAAVCSVQDTIQSPSGADGSGVKDAASSSAAEHDAAAEPLIGPAARPAHATNVRAQGSGYSQAAAVAQDELLCDVRAAAAAEPAAKRRRIQDGRRGNKNANMHPRSRYAQHEPNFAALAAKHPGLAEFTALRPDGRFRLPVILS